MIYNNFLNLYNETSPLKASKGDFKNVNHAYIQFLIALRYNQNNK